jgi:hypothetical protein
MISTLRGVNLVSVPELKPMLALALSTMSNCGQYLMAF